MPWCLYFIIPSSTTFYLVISKSNVAAMLQATSSVTNTIFEARRQDGRRLFPHKTPFLSEMKIFPRSIFQCYPPSEQSPPQFSYQYVEKAPLPILTLWNWLSWQVGLKRPVSSEPCSFYKNSKQFIMSETPLSASQLLTFCILNHEVGAVFVYEVGNVFILIL